MRAPLLLALGVVLAFEAIGGLVIFVARLAFGSTPGEALHIVAGALLAALYAIYQVRHWRRVGSLSGRLDYAIGLLAAIFMAAALLTGFALAVAWWQARVPGAGRSPTTYAPVLSAAHNILSMLVLTFVGAHLGAVLMRDRRAAALLRLKSEE